MIGQPNHRDTPRHTKANTEVEDQLNYISQGPFPEELKQALITVHPVLRCAVLCRAATFACLSVCIEAKICTNRTVFVISLCSKGRVDTHRCDAQEVLSFATQDGHSRPHMIDQPGPSRQMEEDQQAEDEKFVHQMEQALKLSGCRSAAQ